MAENSSASSGGGFTGLLLLAFIVLKLCGVIEWSWWWVLSPLWIGVALGLAIVAVVAAVVFLKALYDHRKDRRRLRGGR